MRQAAAPLLTWCRRRLCALRGHELTFHFEPNRLSLQCQWCGVETPGWQIDIRRDFQIRRAVVKTPFEHQTGVSGSGERRAA